MVLPPSSQRQTRLHRSLSVKSVRIPQTMRKNARPRKRSGVFWQRMRDSNPRKRSQSPVCYRYTNPLSATTLLYAKRPKSQAVFGRFTNLIIFFHLFPGKRLAFQDFFAQIAECRFLSLITQHGQNIGQFPYGLGMHQRLFAAAQQIIQR